jgi:hypothetical protein
MFHLQHDTAFTLLLLLSWSSATSDFEDLEDDD